MQYRSRLRSRVRNTLYKNTIISVAVIIIILILVGFFGIQLLVKFSLLLGNIKSIGEIPSSQSNAFILPPSLDPLVEATNSAIIEISGRGSEPGQTIEIFLNDSYKTKALVDNDSQFKILQFRLEQGQNYIKSRAKQDDKESSFSEELTVLFETTPPALEVKEPSDGQVIRKTSQVRVVGKTETDTSISINNFLPIVDGSGNFSYTLPLKEGENSIKVIAKDKAGNQTTNELKVTFEP